MKTSRLAFLASPKPVAQKAMNRLVERYGSVAPEQADVIVAIGGDGFMLETLRAHMEVGAAFYGVNRGTVGFLMNPFAENDLKARIREAESAVIHPLRMIAETADGRTEEALAINEVSLLRETRQTARLRVSVNDKVRLQELTCDGVLLSTPAGSTAYNLSAHGPILPIDSRLLALTPISAFRPRRWRGALLPHNSVVTFDVLEAARRPVSAVADNSEVRDVVRVSAQECPDREMTLLFDRGRSLEERILSEQFNY